MNSEFNLHAKQQRLLLLRHAAQCKQPSESCTVTAHCKTLKQLWVHIAGCKNNKCEYEHCVTSRAVLGHYYFCDEVTCEICLPVRSLMLKKQVQVKKHHAQVNNITIN